MLKDKIKDLCIKKNMSIAVMLRSVNMHSCDYYQAVNGTKPFFPSWRKRISEILGTSEEELFFEYLGKSQDIRTV